MREFKLREKLIAYYNSFVKGIIIRDDSLKRIVSDELRTGILWLESLLQLGPFLQ